MSAVVISVGIFRGIYGSTGQGDCHCLVAEMGAGMVMAAAWKLSLRGE